jgi:hypothetical protein
MAYGILIPNAIAALNVDAWNRSAVSASAVENGNIVILSAKSTTAGEGEVFTAVVPSTSNGLTNAWIAYEPEVVLTAAKYKGIDPDPRNFRNEIGDVFSVLKPQLGDILTLTADNFSAAFSSNTHANATNSTGGLKLVWGNSQTGSVFSVKYLATTYISLGTGSVDSQRVTAYQVEVVGL